MRAPSSRTQPLSVAEAQSGTGHPVFFWSFPLTTVASKAVMEWP